MPIFSEGERNREGPPRAGESRFSYLDSSSREEAACARETIEEWLADYPAENFAHWLGDFKSDDDGQHESAFFELFLFQFFKKAGCEIISVEPSFKGQKGNPDFLVRDQAGQEFVVEAISPNFRADIGKGREKLIADIKESINSLKINDYYLILDKIEAPSQAINKRRLTDALSEWINQSPCEDDLFEYEDKGALVHIKVIHRPGREIDSPNYRAIGIEMGGASMSTPGEDIRRGLEKKASKYRALELPYVIALNARSMHDTEDDYLAATYGTSSVVIALGPEGVEQGEPRWVRNPDGLFNDGGRARKRNVSAVLLLNGVKPWQWKDRRSVVIHNAFAKYPVEALRLGGDEWLVDGRSLLKVEGSFVVKNFGDA